MIKVRELIEELLRQDQEAPVLFNVGIVGATKDALIEPNEVKRVNAPDKDDAWPSPRVEISGEAIILDVKFEPHED